MLRPWPPTCMTQPMITSSIERGIEVVALDERLEHLGRRGRRDATRTASRCACPRGADGIDDHSGSHAGSSSETASAVKNLTAQSRVCDRPQSGGQTRAVPCARLLRHWGERGGPDGQQRAPTSTAHGRRADARRRAFLRTRRAPPATRPALRGTADDGLAGVDLRRVADQVARTAARPAAARRRAGRPRRAHDAQRARVPRARPGRPLLRRHADLDLQLVVARPDRVPGRPLRGQGGDRRGRRLPRALQQGARPAARPADRIINLDRTTAASPRRRRAPASTWPRAPRLRRHPTTWPRSSTRRAPPARPRA